MAQAVAVTQSLAGVLSFRHNRHTMTPSPSPRPIDPIRVTPTHKERLDPIERWFVVVLRIIGITLIARALFGWFILTGLFMPPEMPELGQITPDIRLGLFAVMATVGVIAGVGLWLLAPWGAVLWLGLVAADALLFFLLPELGLTNNTVVLMNGGLIVIYLGMLLQVRRHTRTDSYL